MRDAFASVADRLTNAGFREIESGCFTSRASPRVVGLAVCGPDLETWRQKTDDLLRKETMRLAMSWMRYVILLVNDQKTSQLAWAAASFAQDVSKCRRMVLFPGRSCDAPVSLPFLGLPSVSESSVGAPPREVEGIVRSVLSPSLADAFLNEELPNARVQTIAEEDQS